MLECYRMSKGSLDLVMFAWNLRICKIFRLCGIFRCIGYSVLPGPRGSIGSLVPWILRFQWFSWFQSFLCIPGFDLSSGAAGLPSRFLLFSGSSGVSGSPGPRFLWLLLLLWFLWFL